MFSTLGDWITLAALVAGSVSFAIYAIGAGLALAQRRTPASAGAAVEAKGLPVADVTALVEAVTKLADSLAKAGPTITALMAAILFFAVAAGNNAVDHGPKQQNPAPAAAVVK
jgi:hypothetical protein